MNLKLSSIILFLVLASHPMTAQIISDCIGLQNITNNLVANYVLTIDIDCSATLNWNSGAGFLPIGSSFTPFTGNFNGRNYTIYNLTIYRPNTDYVGLFSSVSGANASIIQLALKGAVIRGRNFVGGLTGYNNANISSCYLAGNVSGSVDVGGLVGYNDYGSISQSHATGSVSSLGESGGLIGYSYYGTITNSTASSSVLGTTSLGGLMGYSYYGTITNSYATGSVSGSDYVGGLVGYSSHDTITNSYATGSVSGSDYVGGLVGESYSGTIIQSHATGNVNGSNYVAGLMGYSTYDTITNNYATSSVSGSGNDVAGLVGYSSYDTITNSYATGSVSGSAYVGGLVGDSYSGAITQSFATGNVSGASNYVGGLVGYGSGSITQCYATASVTGVSGVGGLAGYNSGSIINSYAIGHVTGSNNVGGLVGTDIGGAYSSYWNIQTSGQIVSASGIGDNTFALYQNATYLGWDFNCVWSINEGIDTPKLTLNQCNPSPFVQKQVSNCKELQLAVFLYTTDIILMQDIDCSSTVTWNNGAGFQPGRLMIGTFDGFGHRIMNLFINRTSTVQIGLFAKIDIGAQIQNVILERSTISGSTYVGGLVGYNSGVIIQSSVTGSIFGSSYAGGLVGYNNAGTISLCYAMGNVSGSIYTGGLIGYNDYGAISQSYASSSVTGSTYAGGLVGGAIVITGVTSAYWDIQTSTQAYSSGGVGLVTVAMQQPTSFVGWDFTGTWVMNVGHTYPLLRASVVLPVLSTPLNNLTQNVGTSLDFTIPTNTFIDPNGLRLTFTAGLSAGFPLPAWILFNPSTQRFSGTPLSGTQGVLLIEISAYNLASQSISTVLQLTIPNRPPTLNAQFIQQYAFNGQPFQFIVPAATFFDPDGDLLSLTASLQNGTPLPAWLSFHTALGVFSGTSTQRGTQWINVTANDGFGGQAVVLLEILTPNTAPRTMTTFPNQVLTVAQPFNFTITANIFFDLDGDPLTYSASLLGGGQLLSWLNFIPQTLSFQGTPDTAGFWMISVTATDTYNATALLNFGVSATILSGNAPPQLAIQMLDQTATVGQPFTLTLPNNMFIDINGDLLTYSAMLEGGAPLPNWLNFSSTSLILSGVAATTGSLHITVRADDGGGGFALDTFTLTIINNQNLPPFLQNPISNQVVSVGNRYQFSIPSNTFTDVNNSPLSYTATTSSNGPLPSWLRFNINTRTFSGKPSDTDTNLYAPRTTTIEVRASNAFGSAVATFEISVTGISQLAKIINALITFASIASAAFAVYRNRAWLWNTFLRIKYEKETKEISFNEMFTYQFNVASKQIKLVKAFNKTSSKPMHKKSYGCPKWCSFNRYQELLDDHLLPDWLHFDRNTMTISGTAIELIDLYICAVGYDDRYLEAFKLCSPHLQGEGIELQSI